MLLVDARCPEPPKPCPLRLPTVGNRTCAGSDCASSGPQTAFTPQCCSSCVGNERKRVRAPTEFSPVHDFPACPRFPLPVHDSGLSTIPSPRFLVHDSGLRLGWLGGF